MNNSILPAPCESCPYRKDVPSGVWSAKEYRKLRGYDKVTGEQPPNGFACHCAPQYFCHGWAVVHSNRGDQFELLALRIAAFFKHIDIPKPGVPLFPSGTEAARHGLRDVKRPSAQAILFTRRLFLKYPRLKSENPGKIL